MLGFGRGANIGRFSISTPAIPSGLRLAEFVATLALALAQDNAFGQPLESQLRSCLLARWICEAAGLDEALCETVYGVALRRYIGCTGHAHEVSSLFGDEIAIRARMLVHDAASPADVMHDVVAFATAGKGDHHIQHIYTKIGVSTRAAAMLWAIPHAVVP